MDWSRIETLKEEIGPDDLPEVVELFLAEAQDVVARIAAGSGGPGLAADLHALKGTALNLGFTEVAGLCRSAESLAATGSGAGIDRHAVADMFARSADALRGYLSRRAPSDAAPTGPAGG